MKKTKLTALVLGCVLSCSMVGAVSGCNSLKPNSITGLNSVSLNCQEVLNTKLSATATSGVAVTYKYSQTENGEYVALPANYQVSAGEFYVKAYAEATEEYAAAESAAVKVTVSHKYGSEWQHSATEHYHVCVCGDKSDVAAHEAEAGAVWQKDETTDKHYKNCICGVRVDEAAHTAAADAQWEKDDDNHWKSCECGEKVEVAAHAAAADAEWLSDDDTHWKVCECGEKVEFSTHDWQDAGVQQIGDKYYSDTLKCECGQIITTGASKELTPIDGKEGKYSLSLFNWLTDDEAFNSFKTNSEAVNKTSAEGGVGWGKDFTNFNQLKGGQNGWWAGCNYGWDASVIINADGYLAIQLPAVDFTKYDEVSFKLASVNTNSRSIHAYWYDSNGNLTTYFNEVLATIAMTKDTNGQSNGGTQVTFTFKNDGKLYVTGSGATNGAVEYKLEADVANGSKGMILAVKGTGGAAFCMSDWSAVVSVS